MITLEGHNTGNSTHLPGDYLDGNTGNFGFTMGNSSVSFENGKVTTIIGGKEKALSNLSSKSITDLKIRLYNQKKFNNAELSKTKKSLIKTALIALIVLPFLLASPILAIPAFVLVALMARYFFRVQADRNQLINNNEAINNYLEQLRKFSV